MISIYHLLIKFFARKSFKDFNQNTHQLKNTQEKILKNIVGNSYEAFILKNPVSDYSFFQSQFENVLKEGQVKCVPTSGSTNAIKWIPYTDKFKKELWQATGPWLFDLYDRYPEIKNGKHFWSMSWLPDNLRSQIKTNDLEVFSFFERILMKKTMALNESDVNQESLHQAMLVSTLALINKNVTVISVWSPTFLLEMLQLIFSEKDYFIKNSNSHISSTLKKYSEVNMNLCREVFPRLKLISCWDTGASEFLGKEIKKLFPNVYFQGKGLWSTEGVVTIPFLEKHVLSYRSHFYEFECVETKKIYPSWGIRKNKIYSVILTTSSGLIRYRLNDLVLVYDFLGQVPCLKFIGRDKEIDLVGEKLNHLVFKKLIEDLKHELDIIGFSFVAKSFPHPSYFLILDKIYEKRKDEVIVFLENKLLTNFHYRLAREANQLSRIEIEFSTNPMDTYLKYQAKKIEIQGNIKIEPVIAI